MDSHQIAELLGILAIVLAAARLLGSAARADRPTGRAGRASGGRFLGRFRPGPDRSRRSRSSPNTLVFHFLQEVGVVILLFEIGLETDLVQLLRAGASSTAVAVAGVVLPFAGGYLVCHFFGLEQ